MFGYGDLENLTLNKSEAGSLIRCSFSGFLGRGRREERIGGSDRD